MFLKALTLLYIFCFHTLPGIAPAIDVQHYKYDIELTDASDAITGKATIRVTFLAGSSQLLLQLASLDGEKGMLAYAVTEGGKKLQVAHRNNELLIYLSQAAKTGEVRSFEISYMGVPDDGLIISKNKFGDRTFFADNWPNRAHRWLPCNDVPGDKASVEFIVTAPAVYKVISNGLLLEEKFINGGRKRTHWKEDLPIPTKVMVIGAARFAVKEVDSAYAVPVTAWLYPQDSAKGFHDYSLADDILRFFETYIGPYPYKKLANVQSTTMFGGMENASAIFYGEKTVTGTRSSEALMAHEIVHQWFGNTATEKSFAHLWLSEGFATYLTNMYVEHRHGRDSLVQRLQNERAQVIDFAQKWPQPVVDSISGFMELLNANSYQKGGWVLHMLRTEAGDSVFKKIIQNYYKRYQWANADTRDFQKVAEEVSGKNLDVFFNQWLYRPGIPQLNVQTKLEKGSVRVTVTQTGSLFTFPLEVEVLRSDGSSQLHTIAVSQKETVFLMDVPGAKKIVIDPQTKLLFARK
ncbi:MAG: M1 family metallopeptidase [Chitinophagaceae bacterium]